MSFLIPVINILGKSVHLNEVAIHTSSDVSVENAKNMTHNQGHMKQDSKPRYSTVHDFAFLVFLIFICSPVSQMSGSHWELHFVLVVNKTTNNTINSFVG